MLRHVFAFATASALAVFASLLTPGPARADQGWFISGTDGFGRSTGGWSRGYGGSNWSSGYARSARYYQPRYQPAPAYSYPQTYYRAAPAYYPAPTYQPAPPTYYAPAQPYVPAPVPQYCVPYR
jgi:hypothetical protein